MKGKREKEKRKGGQDYIVREVKKRGRKEKRMMEREYIVGEKRTASRDPVSLSSSLPSSLLLTSFLLYPSSYFTLYLEGEVGRGSQWEKERSRIRKEKRK